MALARTARWSSTPCCMVDTLVHSCCIRRIGPQHTFRAWCTVQGFLQVDLSDDEIGMIVDTLVYDTLVDRVPQVSTMS